MHRTWKLAVAIFVGVFVISVINMQSAEAAPNSFKDVHKNDSFYNEVMDLASREIINGFPDGTYRPTQELTRGQAAKLIAELLNLDLTKVKNPKFKDVPETHPYYAYIAALTNKKIISGYKDKTFGPNNTLTRGQMAKILAGAYEFDVSKVTKPPFKDVSEKDGFAPYIQALMDQNITTGTSSGTFSPYNRVTRSQMALFLHRSDEAKFGEYVTVTVRELKDNQLFTNKGIFNISEPLKNTLLSAQNTGALQGSKISFRFIHEVISEIEDLELTASGANRFDVTFDGGFALIKGNLTIQGDHVRVRNVDVARNMTVGAAVVTSFNGQNINVRGKTIVNDSNITRTSTSTIALNDVITNELLLDKKNALIILENKTSVKKVEVNKDAEILTEEKTKLDWVEVVGDVGRLELNANVNNLDAKSSKPLFLTGKGLITKLEVDAPEMVLIHSGGKINKVVLTRKSWIQIGPTADIGNLEIPLGLSGIFVVANYNTAIRNVQQINGARNPDYLKPSTGPSVTEENKRLAGIVTNLIAAIDKNKTSYTADVAHARLQYNRLTADQQKLVRNLAILVKAEAGIVRTTEEFKLALANRSVDYIILGSNIVLEEFMNITRTVEINGNGFDLSVKDQNSFTEPNRNSVVVVRANKVFIHNLSITVPQGMVRDDMGAMYIPLEVLDVLDTTLLNVKVTNGHVGVYVNAATKNASAGITNIETIGSELGGIGVASATEKVKASLTTKTDGNKHGADHRDRAIWSEGPSIDIDAQGYIIDSSDPSITYYEWPIPTP